MSGVTRRLLGGVLAISLFMCSSLSVFAAVQVGQNTFYQYVFTGVSASGVSVLSSNNNISASDLSSSFSVSEPIRTLNVYLNFQGDYYSELTTHTFIFRFSDDTPASLFGNLSIRANSDTSVYYPVDIVSESYSVLSGNAVSYTVSYIPLSNESSSDNVRPYLAIQLFNSDDVHSYYDVTSVEYSLFVFSNLSPMPTSPPSHGSSIPGVVGDVFGTVNSISGLVDLNIDWSGMTYGITNWFSDEFSPFLLSLFSSVQSSFISLTGNIGSFFSSFFSRLDQQEDNYTAVTDPATSQEIQDTQDMIDDVEDFEALLNQNITTEFNKIDFTTPSNLAAPVAFVADKVTRSVNSLGSGFQPLVFVPLTLGIMLIMLGRGVTALGTIVGRSSAAKRSDRGDE